MECRERLQQFDLRIVTEAVACLEHWLRGGKSNDFRPSQALQLLDAPRMIIMLVRVENIFDVVQTVAKPLDIRCNRLRVLLRSSIDKDMAGRRDDQKR